MAIVSMNYTKIHAEKNQPIKGNINVANDVSITNVEKANFNMGSVSQDCLRIFFKFTSKSEPNFGEILIEGEVFFLAKPEDVKNSVESWKEKKPIDKAILTPVINHVLSKCNVESLILSQTIGLPPPIKLPTVTLKDKEVNASEKVPVEEEKKSDE